MKIEVNKNKRDIKMNTVGPSNNLQKISMG